MANSELGNKPKSKADLQAEEDSKVRAANERAVQKETLKAAKSQKAAKDAAADAAKEANTAKAIAKQTAEDNAEKAKAESGKSKWFIFTGDEHGNGPASSIHFGVEFIMDKPTKISDPLVIAKLTHNSHFDRVEDDQVEAMKKSIIDKKMAEIKALEAD